MREELVRCWAIEPDMDMDIKFAAWSRARGGGGVINNIRTCDLTSLQGIYAIYLLHKLKGN